MKTLYGVLLVGALLVGLSSVANAQIVPNAPHLTFQDRTAFLLTAVTIRDDLQLSDSQRKAIDRHWVSYSDRVDALSKKSGDTSKAFENLERQVAGQSLGVLDDLQKRRLRELGIQNVGPRALLDEGVARAFEVGSRQLSAIKGLYDAYDAKMNEVDDKVADALGGEGIPKDQQKLAAYEKRREQLLKTFEAERIAIRKTRAEIDRKAIEVLNGDQIINWKQSQGKPFAFVGNNQ